MSFVAQICIFTPSLWGNCFACSYNLVLSLSWIFITCLELTNIFWFFSLRNTCYKAVCYVDYMSNWISKQKCNEFRRMNASCFSFEFYWSSFDFQHCVNFCCKAKWFSYAYLFFFMFFSIMVYHRIFNRIPCAIQ